MCLQIRARATARATAQAGRLWEEEGEGWMLPRSWGADVFGERMGAQGASKCVSAGGEEGLKQQQDNMPENLYFWQCRQVGSSNSAPTQVSNPCCFGVNAALRQSCAAGLHRQRPGCTRASPCRKSDPVKINLWGPVTGAQDPQENPGHTQVGEKCLKYRRNSGVSESQAGEREDLGIHLREKTKPRSSPAENCQQPKQDLEHYNQPLLHSYSLWK